MNKYIPLSVPNLCGNEKKYMDEAIKSEWVSTAGTYVNRFEKEIAKYLGVDTACACQSGTAAIHLALLASKVGQGDEVIVPTLTFIAAVNPVSYVNAKPIFMDCDNSLCMDPVKLNEFCTTQCIYKDGILVNKTSGNRIKAIIVVHVFGNMADMEAICDIADKYGLIVIEDATEALGTKYTEGRYKDSFAGTIGHIGCYSFNGNKIITTGGGGMVVAKDANVLAYIKYLSTQAKDDAANFIHNEIGYNYRMTNIQAALGVAQLEQLENFIKIKEENYQCYIDNGIELLQFKKGIRTNYWFYSYMAVDSKGQNFKIQLIDYLTKEKIQARPIWGLIHEQKPYVNCMKYKIEKAKFYGERIVNLPCSSNLTADEVKYVAQAIKLF